MSTSRLRRNAQPSAKQRQINEEQAIQAQVVDQRRGPKPPPGTRGRFTSGEPIAGKQPVPSKRTSTQTLNQGLRAKAAAPNFRQLREAPTRSRPPMTNPSRSHPMHPLPGRAQVQPTPVNSTPRCPTAAKPVSATSGLRGQFKVLSVQGTSRDNSEHIATAQALDGLSQHDARDEDLFAQDEDQGDVTPEDEGETELQPNTMDDQEEQLAPEEEGDNPVVYPEEEDAPVYNPEDYPFHEEEAEGHSTEVVNGRKHRRSLTTEATDSIQRQTQCRRLINHAGCPRQKDYDDTTQQVIKTTSDLYECALSTVDAFPDRGTEIDMAHEAWHGACQREDLNLRISPELVHLLMRQGSHLRGDVKTKARPFVAGMYGFSSSHGKKQIAQNRRLVELLQDKGSYKFRGVSLNVDSALRPEDVYKHPCIQQIFNDVWFGNRRASGVVYAEHFQDTVAPLALVITAIKHCIDEWETGSRASDKHFTEREYATVYRNNVQDLQDYHAITEKNETGILKKIVEKLIRNGRKHAGVGTLETAGTEDRISHSIFEEAAAAYATVDADMSSDDDMDD